ncbi:MAG: Fic family protein [Thermoanaerobaculales bacterium]|nr:Fic family protein [Thermoanaerobaculales bacterium]
MDSLSSIRMTPELVRAIGEIDEFKGRWESLGKLAPERLQGLRRIATIESVGSSTRIEGVTLTDEEIERLLSGIRAQSFRTRDEQEVAGYADVMELIFESYADIPLTENHIHQLHGILLKHSDKDERHRGSYKKLPNHVEAVDESGQSLGVIFETATPFDTPRLMEGLVASTNDALSAGRHHQLLIIGHFVVRFLAIHPYQDGNGRLSRALTTLLLLKAGYSYVPYSSLERIIEESKDQYYLALRRAQATLDGDESQLIDWLIFFIRCLVQQKEVLERKIAKEKLMAPLPPLSNMLMVIVLEHGRATVREAVALTGANRNTIKDHLKRLVEGGRLTRHGRGKGTWYERAP